MITNRLGSREVRPAILARFVARAAITVLLLFGALMLLPPAKSGAADATPAGVWRTIDDHAGKTKGLIRVKEVNGRYEGVIEKIFPQPGEDPNPKCDQCDGSRRDQPVLGMTILWGLTKQGDEYQDGEILDPENGKIYRARVKLLEGGKKLDVRGFIGFSLFGRSQTWLREE